MPIAKLFVEGNLESEVLNPILSGSPVLQIGGSKNSLRPHASAERKENKVTAGYLRDRDFDFDPPIDLSTPTVDGIDNDIPFGWRWCRHEIESYLIDPTIIHEAMAWPVPDIENAICEAAGQIRYYEAARWTVGIVRRVLPPHYDLKTRPGDLNEIALPQDLSEAAVEHWALSDIETHRSRIAVQTDRHTIQTTFQEFSTRFDGNFIANTAQILLWFSGKDILAGMSGWLAAKGVANPGEFRASLRNWIIAYPERTLELLPEWRALIEVLRS
jgi:hypothetical protein